MSRGFAASRAELVAQWPLVVGSTVCVLFMYGVLTTSLPFFYQPVMEEFGWTREQATFLSSMKYLTGALSSLLIGEIVDRLGEKGALVLMAVLGAVTMVSFLAIDSLPSYYLAGAGIGMSAIGILVPIKVLMSRRFTHAQGLSIGIMQWGSTITGTITPAITVTLISLYGWREAMALLSLGIWFVSIPLCLLIFKNSPKQSMAETVRAPETKNPRAATPEGGRPERSVFRSPALWAMGLGIFLVAAVDQALIQHAVLFLQVDVGLAVALVVVATSSFSLIGSVSKIFFGWIYDRYSIKGVIAGYAAAGISAVIGTIVGGPITMMLFVLGRGLAHGGLVIEAPILAKHCFGLKNIGRMIGLLGAVMYTGFAFGPWLMARIHDQTGSYTLAFWLFGAFCLIACLLLAPIRPRYYEEVLRDREQTKEPETSGANPISTAVARNT
jgi:MFS family permease